MWLRCLRNTISRVKNFEEGSSKIHVSSCLLIPNPCLFLVKVRSISSSSPSVSAISSLSNADLVITLLESYGFTKPFISKIITKYPPILSSDPHKTLIPNIDFFISKGLSGLELAKFIYSNPNLLKRNLQNHIIPPFNVLKNILKSDKNVITTLKRQSREFLNNKLSIEKMMFNIELLRNQGVPQSNITKFLISQPRALTIITSKFKEIVEEIKDTGFDPYKTTYLLAIQVINGLSKSNRESRMDVYRRLGWSEEQIHNAFRYHPLCMLTSEKKITSVMDYLVNQMGYSSSYIAQYPIIMCYSLEKRIIPRCSVYKILTSKGLVKKKNCPKFTFADV
ncbi:uncharacterized protein LOC113339099 [Papaver somniferum]|uniref:uncharacterized protein LOC113339099 n=1 Tax=Papaver somniferum TaxID=3469 RepID=UPI000E7013CF|nr:uncharacterized protein LOC113339099 [Papaver somniferum]XP_026440286.1 uncharacterized protein LOC113339099 [Papaver somniferum]